MRLLNKAAAIFDRTNDLLTFFAGILLYIIAIGVLVMITVRLFGTTAVWIFDITEYAILWITFLGTTWVLKRKQHVKTELITDRLAPKTRALLNIITSAIAAITCLVVAWYGAMITWEYYQIGYVVPTEWRPLEAPIIMIIPVGCFLLFIQFLRETNAYLKSWRRATE